MMFGKDITKIKRVTFFSETQCRTGSTSEDKSIDEKSLLILSVDNIG